LRGPGSTGGKTNGYTSDLRRLGGFLAQAPGAARPNSPRSVRRSPDRLYETAPSQVAVAARPNIRVSGLGNASYGRYSSPQLRAGRVLAGEMPHDASGTGLADLERLMAGQAGARRSRPDRRRSRS